MWAKKHCNYLLMWLHLFLHWSFIIMRERTVKKLNEFSPYIEIDGIVTRTVGLSCPHQQIII